MFLSAARPTRLTRHVVASSVALIALGTLAACGSPSAADTPTPTPSPTQGIIAGTLQVSAARPSLTLRNTTEFVVGYMVVEKDMGVVAMFPPCGERCPTIAQGASASVMYRDIAGYSDQATDAIVMWWTYAPGRNGTLTPQGAVNTVQVRL